MIDSPGTALHNIIGRYTMMYFAKFEAKFEKPSRCRHNCRKALCPGAYSGGVTQ